MSRNLSTDDEAALTPSQAEIRERAYDLWDRNHRPDSYELEFWLMAERELKAEWKALSKRKNR